MFPWYINLLLFFVVLAGFRAIWSCSTPSGFPTHRLHPSQVDKAAASQGD